MTARFPTPDERDRRARLIALLDEGKVLVQISGRHAGVDLPPHLRDELVVGLALSRRFGLPVLELGPLQVEASLSFGDERYLCVVPWMAIFAMRSYVSEEQAFYPESIPPELLAGLELARLETDSQPAPEVSEVPEEPDEAPAARPPTLRLVKS